MNDNEEPRRVLSDEEKERFISAIEAGTAVICNCNFGLMLRQEVLPDGRMHIYCPNENVDRIRHPYHAEYVRKALAAWGEALNEYDQRRLGLH
jgi:hypothetical protein